jgi:hypothetical protein
MFVALCATALGVMATARALGLGPRRQAAAGAIVALTPLLLGDFVATRFDLALAALLAWTAWAAAARRWRAMWGLVAAGVVLKLMPLALVPLLVIWHARHRGAGAAARGAAGALAAAALVFLPFLVASPEGVGEMFRYHLDRPLQIESTGASYLLGLHVLAEIPLRVETSFGSQNLVGPGPDVIAGISTGVLIVGLAAVCVMTVIAWRRRPDADAAILSAGLAGVLAVAVAAGKVLSPQFMVWLLAVVPVVATGFGRRALVVLAAALVATQLYFPVRYQDLVELDSSAIGLLVLRNAVLVGLVAVCWPRGSGPGGPTPAQPAGTLSGEIATARPSEPASISAP